MGSGLPVDSAGTELNCRTPAGVRELPGSGETLPPPPPINIGSRNFGGTPVNQQQNKKTNNKPPYPTHTCKIT